MIVIKHKTKKDNEDFLEACEKGDYSYANEDYAFTRSCAKGHLRLAQWLYSLGNVNIHANNDAAFCWSCGNGYLEVAKWLYSLGNVNINAKHNYAFYWSNKMLHFELFQWLTTIK